MAETPQTKRALSLLKLVGLGLARTQRRAVGEEELVAEDLFLSMLCWKSDDHRPDSAPELVNGNIYPAQC